MEKESAIGIFSRSIEKHTLRYTSFVEDSDSSLSGSVKEVLNKMFGDQYPIEKEDHIQKSMGTAVRAYKNKHRGAKLSDGKSAVGSGHLRDVIVDRICAYYGYAIHNNKGKTEAIK